MKICPICSTTTTSDKFKFCYRDGATLTEMQKCSCGEDLMPIDKFCSVCGQRNDEFKERPCQTTQQVN